MEFQGSDPEAELQAGQRRDQRQPRLFGTGIVFTVVRRDARLIRMRTKALLLVFVLFLIALAPSAKGLRFSVGSIVLETTSTSTRPAERPEDVP